jgi:glutamyl-tRNA reductase
MGVTVVGLSHRTAPIETRERCAYSTRDLPEVLSRLCHGADQGTGAREAVVLSTCNRTELYLVDGARDAVPTAWALLDERLLGSETDARSAGYVRRDREAVRHLMRVASGLDSMVIGEAQIQGQVRDAWEMSRQRTGPVLNRLFQTALAVGGRVRSETAIARGAGSVSSAAVQLAKKIFGSLQGRRAMVLGAGEMAELALECLISGGVRAVLVANRTFDRAMELARRHGATAVRFDEYWAQLASVDLVVCSTSAPHPVLQFARVESALRGRGDRPLCVLDIAMPRDVEPAVGTLDNVFLYDLDDLRAVVAANLDARRAELPSAEQLIDGEVEKYWEWLAGLAAVPVVTHFRAEMERIRANELANAMRRLGPLTPTQREAVERLSKSLMQKFLHEPSVRLRAAAANGRGLGIVDAARYLFGLDAPAPADTADAEGGARGEAEQAPTEAQE